MRATLLTALALVLTLLGAAPTFAQDSSPPADLREYYLVLLVNPGPERIPMSDALFAQHMAYMNRGFASGAYKIGGPVTDGGRIRGVIIVEAETLDAARDIVEHDPAVLADVIGAETHPMLTRDLAALDERSPLPNADSAPPSDLREYFLVMMVNAGAERIPMPDDVFAQHMAYRNARAASGAYKTGGPVTDGGRIRGVSIVEADNLEAARAMAEQDPAVQAGVLTPEAHPMLSRDLSVLGAARGRMTH